MCPTPAMRLADALAQSTTATLRRVAAAHGLAHDDGTTRDELIRRLADRLAEPAYLAEQLRGLAPEAQAVLASAHASAGELRGLLLDADHPGTADNLAERGWLFRVFSSNGPLRGEVFVVPDELLTLLPAPEAVDQLPSGVAPPGETRRSDPAFSLFALVSALTRPGGDLEQEVRPWSEEPGGWAWDARWTFFRHLALGANWLVHRADGSLGPAPTLARLLDDPHALAERAWRSYQRDRGWSELARAGVEALAETGDAEDLVDHLALRTAMVDVLPQLPEGEWLELDAISAWLERSRPTLVREQLTPRGLVLLQGVAWPQLEANVVRAFLLGPFYWLGVVSASRDGRLVSRREATRATPDACRWEGAADLVAPATARLGALLRAERYLVLRERARLSRYHLVQSHVASALGTGGSVAECRQLLQELTQTVMPPAIDERLQGWDQRFGALDIRPAVLLEGRAAADLDAATTTERVRPFIRRRLAPTVAEVAAADALELAAALRAADHLPRVDAALRLAAEPKRAYAGLVDEQVLEFLLVSLLAFDVAWPERLAELEGSRGLLERLEHQFPPARLAELRTAAGRLAGTLSARPPSPRRRGPKRSR